MKPISRSSKSDRPSDRKLASLIKSKSSRPSSNRSIIPRGRSPEMKRPPMHLKKGPHSSRPHASARRSNSPYSIPRGLPPPSIDSSKYVKKRKPYSHSPPPGRSSAPIRKHLSPPPHGRLPRNGSRPSPGFESRKKIRREPPKITSVQRPMDKNMHSHPESHMPHRVIGPPQDYIQDRGREYTSRPTNVRPMYASAAGSSQDGFNISERNQPRRVIDSSYEKNRERDYISVREKHHSQTLDERFRNFTDMTRGQEHRIQYSKADLENITVDVKRGTRPSSPTVRKILNPADVKLVRHPSEGHRPIFDREEIKHSPRDMREDPYNEQKLAGGTHFGLNYGELENFEITRHKFDTTPYQGPPVREESSTILSEKWRRIETHRSNISLDSDERPQAYVRRSRSPEPYPERRPHSASYMRRPHSSDRDFREQRYPPVGDRIRPSSDYLENRRPLPNDPSDLRHSLAVKKKDALHNPRPRPLERRSGHDHPSSHDDYRQNYLPAPRRPPDNSSEKMRVEKRSISPSSHRMEYARPRRESSYSHERSLDRGRPRHTKPPEYLRRSDERYKHHSSDLPIKGPNYYENDKREPLSSYRSSRGGRSFRGRSIRSRPTRGLIRGSSSRGRGSFRPPMTFRGRSSFPSRR